MVATGTGEAYRQSAVQAGLRLLGSCPVFLLNQKKESFRLPANFQFQLADSDGLYLDTGNASYLS